MALPRPVHRPLRSAARWFALVAGLLLVLAPVSGAAPRKAIWGPVSVDGTSQFPIYQELGVNLYQFGVNWSYVAANKPTNPTDPNDPAYVWPVELDMAVAEGQRTGIDVLVMITQAPKWSNGGKSSEYPPTDPDDYAKFAEALAKRYPTVKHFMVWGEPIYRFKFHLTRSSATYRDYYGRKSGKLRPLKAINSKQRLQVQGYARIVDATYGRLKALDSKNLIIGGNSTTTGDIDPFNWVRFMRMRNGKPPRMDLYGHNPFGVRGPDLKKKQVLEGTADMSDLDVYEPWVRKYMARSGRNAKIKLFISEFTAPTDQPSFEFNFYVTRKLQAQWLRAAWNITKAEKYYGLGWINLRDIVQPNGQASLTGLIDKTGARKPSFDVFKSLK